MPDLPFMQATVYPFIKPSTQAVKWLARRFMDLEDRRNVGRIREAARELSPDQQEALAQTDLVLAPKEHMIGAYGRAYPIRLQPNLSSAYREAASNEEVSPPMIWIKSIDWENTPEAPVDLVGLLGHELQHAEDSMRRVQNCRDGISTVHPNKAWGSLGMLTPERLRTWLGQSQDRLDEMTYPLDPNELAASTRDRPDLGHPVASTGNRLAFGLEDQPPTRL